jgi:hypothetical protein
VDSCFHEYYYKGSEYNTPYQWNEGQYEDIYARVERLDVPRRLKEKGVVYDFNQFTHLPPRPCNMTNKERTDNLRAEQKRTNHSSYFGVSQRDQSNEKTFWTQHATDAVPQVVKAFQLANVWMLVVFTFCDRFRCR